MTNIIAFLCCVSGGMLVGLHFRKRALQKNQFYSDLVRYISALQLNVTGRQTELAVFNADFVQRASQVFAEASKNRRYPFCSASQKKDLDDFFGNLDCVGSGALLEHLNFFRKQFEPVLAECAAEAKKSSLYVKLGLLLGAMAGILFL